MSINLGSNYGSGVRNRNRTENDEQARNIIGPGVMRLIKIAIVLCCLLISYMVLFSKVMQYQNETVLWSEIYSNVRNWGNENDKKIAMTITERESALVLSADVEFTKNLGGYIVVQVEESGEAWYVHPVRYKKYFLGKPEQAYKALRKLGESTTNAYLKKYKYFPEDALGKVLLDAEDIGQAYYIYPKTKEAVPLLNPGDAAMIMQSMGVSISNKDIRKIPVGDIEKIN